MIGASVGRRVWVGLVAGVVLLGARPALGEDLEAARQLLNQGQATQAYEVLAAMEDRMAGEPGYDYLLGIAALDAGKPGVAVFALERAVAVEPDNAQARAELARAYFVLRDNELAKKELENVKAMAPPESVQATINKYLDALDQRFESMRTHVAVYAEFGVGFDTNINSAADNDNFVFPSSSPFFLLAPLTNENPEENAPYFTGELGAGVTHSVTPDLYFFVNGSATGRENMDGEDYDDIDLKGSLGLRYFRGANTVTATILGERFDLDGNAYRRTGGLSLQWQYTLNGANQITGFARFANLNYEDSVAYPGNSINDVSQRLVGLAWGHSLGGAGSPLIFLSGYLADESADDSVLTSVNGVLRSTKGHAERDYWGVRLGGQYSPRDDLDLLGSISYQDSDYDGVHPSFTDREREDELWYLTLGADWRAAAKWTIKPRLTFARNVSNVPLSDYDRVQVFVNARYAFD